jgi:hypothetical protein
MEPTAKAKALALAISILVIVAVGGAIIYLSGGFSLTSIEAHF